MKFVPVLTNKEGDKVLFSIWETRSKDYAAFMKHSNYAMKVYAPPHGNNGFTFFAHILKSPEDWKTYSYKDVPVGRGLGEDAEKSSHPVANVSNEDAAAFCAWLTNNDRASGLIGPQDEYRLPTDTEWSYAVGIGDKEDASASPEDKDGKLTDIYPWGSFLPPHEGSGNYADEDAKAKGVNTVGVIESYHDGFATTAPVGSFKANSFGLYDLGGNLWEWTSSAWEPGKASRVLRGASWNDNDAYYARSSTRYGFDAGDRSNFFGFRCVLVVGGGG